LSTQKVEQLSRQETPSGKKSAGKCVNRLNSGVNASHGLSPFGPHFALLTDFLNCDLLTVAMAAGVGVHPIFLLLLPALPQFQANTLNCLQQVNNNFASIA